MEELKKGHLIESGYSFTFNVSICEGKICNDSEDFYNFYMDLVESEKDLLNTFFTNPDHNIKDEKVCELLKRFCDDKILKNVGGLEIIYKDFVDSRGNKYGVEYLTELPFPVLQGVTGEYSLRISKNIKAYRGDPSYNTDSSIIFYRHGRDRYGHPKFISNIRKGMRFYTPIKGKDVKGFALYNSLADIKNTNVAKASYSIVSTDVFRYEVSMVIGFTHDNMNRLETVLFEGDYANQADLHQYEQRSEWAETKGKIRERYKRNTFKDNNLLNRYEDKDEKSNNKENSSMLNLINDIDALLFRIKDINPALYKKLDTEYQDIVDKDTIVESDKYKELTEFFERLSGKTSLPIDGPEASEFLDNYIEKLLDDMVNKRFSNISLTYLTQLHKEFLNNENNYGIKYIKKINGKINLLYFLYLYNYRDDYHEKEISESYINSSIKGIVNVIEALHNLGVIKCPNEITSVTYNPINNDITTILKLMNNIEFNDVEKVKELIK